MLAERSRAQETGAYGGCETRSRAALGTATASYRWTVFAALAARLSLAKNFAVAPHPLHPLGCKGGGSSSSSGSSGSALLLRPPLHAQQQPPLRPTPIPLFPPSTPEAEHGPGCDANSDIDQDAGSVARRLTRP